MNLEPTEEQVALRDTVRRFLAERAPVAGYVRPLLGQPAGMSASVWNDFAELGTTGMLVSEEHGGAGMTMVEAGIVLEELGRALHPAPWLSTAVAVPRALARFDAADAADLLTGITKGTTIATLAVTGPRTPVGIAAHGHDVRLTGELRDVPDAAAAGALLVICSWGENTALFAADTASPSVEVTPEPAVDLTRRRFRVQLDGVPARRLGAAGPDAARAVVDDLLTAWAADALGAAQAVFELAVDYAKVRTQFDRPIGAFQAVQHLCVDMYEIVELARGGVMHALWAADAASGEERHLAAVRAKAFSGRLATVGDTAVQVLGGIGFTWEHDAHLYLRRLLGWSTFLGSPDPYLQELGSRLARSAPTARSAR
jgi:acyl-CoA dehydrogenase